MSVQEYKIIGKLDSGAIIMGFQKMQREAQKTSRILINGAREERRARAEAAKQRRDGERLERQFMRDRERDARRAAAEAIRAQRQINQENKRLRAQDIASQRQYIQQLRKQESDLRDRSQKANKVGAAGAVGLGLTAGGLKVAGGLEDAMTDLRISVMRLGSDGKVDLASLNDQMAQFESLAIRLGNTLPGSTRTMSDLFRSMREGGMDAKLILSGAGEAAALLAVTSKEDFETLGKSYAQLLTMSQVKPEDQIKTADLLARINTLSGSKPSEIIEGAKYAIPRGGLPLGLKGFDGLSSTLRLLGLMKRFGLEGSVGGEGIANLMERLPMSTPKAKKAGQKLGLQFFDKKGGFMGEENMIAQFEKLNKLSTKERSKALHDIFGARGTPAAVALGDVIGLKGWKQYEKDLAAIADLNQKAALETSKFSTQLENLTGTAENALAKTFLPLMESIKPALTGANDLLGKFGDFMGQHPTVALYATAVLGLGSAALVTTAGIVKIQTAVNLWKITSAIATAENRLLAGSFVGVGASAGGASRGVDAATGSVKRASLAGTIVRSGLYIGLVLSLEELARQAIETDNALKDMNKTAESAYDSYRKAKEALAAQGKEMPVQITKSAAAGALASLDVGGMFVTNLKDALTNQTSLIDKPSGLRGLANLLNPAATLAFPRDRTGRATEILKERSPELKDSGIMAEFIRRAPGAMGLDANATERLMTALSKAFPESFKQAQEQMAAESQGVSSILRQELAPAAKSAADALRNLPQFPSFNYPGAQPLPGPRIPAAPPKGIAETYRWFPQSFTSSLSNSPTMQRTSGQAGGRITSVAVHVDARGSSSPQEVEAAARRGVEAGTANLIAVVRNAIEQEDRDTVLAV